MHKTIISDTSCFIILTNIGELDLLHKVYGQIVTTPEIAAEFGEPLPDWVEVAAVTDKYRQQLLEMQIEANQVPSRWLSKRQTAQLFLMITKPEK